MDSVSRSGVEQVSALLERMCAINDVARDYGVSKVTEFHSVWKPDLSICDYLSRIQRLTSCSSHVFVLALIYLDTVQRRVGLTVDSLSVHRLMLTAVMIAIKFSEDHPHRNKVYAKAGGLSLQELNQLEVKLLFALDFDLNISSEEFSAYDSALIRASSQATTTSKHPRSPSSDESSHTRSPPARATPCPAPTVVINKPTPPPGEAAATSRPTQKVRIASSSVGPASRSPSRSKSSQRPRSISDIDETDESDSNTTSRWAILKSFASRNRRSKQPAADFDSSRSPSSKRSTTAAEGMLSPSDTCVFEVKGLESEAESSMLGDLPSPRDLISSSDASFSDFSAMSSPHSVTRPLGQLRLSAPRSRSPSKSNSKDNLAVPSATATN